MNSLHIFTPVFAMLLLVCIVGVRTYQERARQFRAMRLHPQKASTRKDFAAAMQDTRSSDNLQNLFETPVLFYVACIGLYATQSVSLVAVAAAWGFVVLRYAHSYVHCGSNTVMTRFKLFFASALAILALWLTWGFALLSK